MSDIDIDVIRKRQYSSPTANADIATLLAEVDRQEAALDRYSHEAMRLANESVKLTRLGNALREAVRHTSLSEYDRTLDAAAQAWDAEVRG